MTKLFEFTIATDASGPTHDCKDAQNLRAVGRQKVPTLTLERRALTPLVKSLPQALLRAFVMISCGATLALVCACGGGGGNGGAVGGGSGSPPPVVDAASQHAAETPAIKLKAPSAAPPVGKTQTLEVTTTGTFSSYQWDFGDGTQAAGGAQVTHDWAKPGHYIVTVTATDSNGATASDSQAIDVVMDQPPAPCTNTSVTGVQEPLSFDGISVLGVLKYTNNSDCSAPVNFSIDGLVAGDRVTLVFSNGQTTSTANGTSTTTPDAHEDTSEEDTAHGVMIEANRRDALAITHDRSRQARVSAAAVPKTRPAPALGTQRNWLVPGDSTRKVSNFNRDTRVAASCALPNGRNLIFWRDNALTTQTYPASHTKLLADTFCGAQGGYARLFALEGAPWGAAANSATNLIKDGTYLQDVNVVLVNNPQLVSWSGIFSTANSFLKTTKPASNEALVVFLAITDKSADQSVMGVLVHESTHLVQYYQSAVYIRRHK